MSWVSESGLYWYHKVFINILKCGPIPRHLAIIMDGNRRYAVKENIQKIAGHVKGFDKLSEVLHWCEQLGIREVTVYAFSIENFKRNDEEVEKLMALAKEKFQKLLEEVDKLKEHEICIRHIGNLSLIPEDLRKLICKAVLQTKDNKKSYLNIAFAYTSHDEITDSIKTIVKGVQEGEINVDAVDENLISGCMYSHESAPPEILIRTSGEVRFSDFLLWQIKNTDVTFTKILWPDFSIWHLLLLIFQYQRRCEQMQKIGDSLKQYEKSEISAEVRRFLDLTNERKLNQMCIYANS